MGNASDWGVAPASSHAGAILATGWSHVREHAFQGPRHSSQIQSVHQCRRRLDLPAAVGAEEAPELLLAGSSPPRRLLLERPEHVELALARDDLLHRGGAE